MIRNLLKNQRSFRALNTTKLSSIYKMQSIHFQFCNQNDQNDDDNQNLKKLQRLKRQKKYIEPQKQQENIKNNIKDDKEENNEEKKEKIKEKGQDEKKQDKTVKETIDSIFDELQKDQKKTKNPKKKVHQTKNDNKDDQYQQNFSEMKDNMQDKWDQFNKKNKDQEHIFNLDQESKKELIDKQLDELKLIRQKLLLKLHSNDKTQYNLKEKIQNLEKNVQEQENISQEQLDFISKLKELEEKIDLQEKEKEELQIKINKILVQQQHIKNEKMKRRIKNSQKEKDNITEKMKNLDMKGTKEEEKKEEEENNQKHYKRFKIALALYTLLNLNNISDWMYDRVFMHSLSYEEFVELLQEKKSIAKIIMNKYTLGSHHMYEAEVVDIQGNHHLLPVGNADNFIENLERVQLEEMGTPIDNLIQIDLAYPSKNKTWLNVMNDVLSLGLGFLILLSVLKGGSGVNSGIFGAAKKIKKFGVDTKVSVKFKDVAGQQGAKQEISEFVEFLKNPKKYTVLGAHLPRGALLTGPPGTGKTLLAKATAGEAECPFYYLSGSDFVEMYVGVGAARVRDLFKQARKKQPCIIFIDEIDAIGKKREDGLGRNQERENTLNQLLVEMDGFDSSSEVIILAATNQHQLLDPALTRPGRFDRQVQVELPDIDGRKEILLIHLMPLRLHPSQSNTQYANRLATLTPGFSGAELANLCNEAAIHASRANKLYVDKIDFEMATERVIAGIEKKSILSQQERHTVAVHESGHAIVSWFLEGGIPLLKLTIIPRSKGSLGFAQYLPNENTLETEQELLDRLCIILGGRMAESHFFNRITTGASDDLQKAYQLAHNIVTKFGMTKTLGYVAFKDEQYTKHVSDHTQDLIDQQISHLIHTQTQRAKDTISQYSSQVQNLSDSLLEKETLDLNDIIGILGERPFEAKENYKAYISAKELEENVSI